MTHNSIKLGAAALAMLAVPAAAQTQASVDAADRAAIEALARMPYPPDYNPHPTAVEDGTQANPFTCATVACFRAMPNGAWVFLPLFNGPLQRNNTNH